MIKFLTGAELNAHPLLKQTMHLDRATQFFDRLGWEVFVNTDGEEYDEYDALNPLYIVLENDFGEHEGSMRFLPTIGRVMINDHFSHVVGGKKICSPFIWECSRFCLSPTAKKHTAAKLMSAGAFLMNETFIDNYIGVFDERMERIYQRLGAAPKVLGKLSNDLATIGIGLWDFDPKSFSNLCKRGKVTPQLLAWYFEACEVAPKIMQQTTNMIGSDFLLERAS